MFSAHTGEHMICSALWHPVLSHVCIQQSPPGWPSQEPRAQTLLSAAFRAEAGHTVCKTYFPEATRVTEADLLPSKGGQDSLSREPPGKLLQRHIVAKASGCLSLIAYKSVSPWGAGTTSCSHPHKQWGSILELMGECVTLKPLFLLS